MTSYSALGVVNDVMIKVRNFSFNIRECGAATAIWKTEVSQ